MVSDQIAIDQAPGGVSTPLTANVSCTPHQAPAGLAAKGRSHTAENFLNITTSQVFGLPSIHRNNLEGLDIRMQKGGGGGSGSTSLCNGCPRDSDPGSSKNCTLCYCLVTKGE